MRDRTSRPVVGVPINAPIESLPIGGWRSLAARTVRDREAPGSNPGPPTNFEFKIADSGRFSESPGHSRGTDSWRTWQRGCEVCRIGRPI